MQMQRLAALEAAVTQRQQDEEDPRSETPRPTREVTPRKQALWKAVRHARLQGVSLRGIARELGISRNTVRKYVDFLASPVNSGSQMEERYRGPPGAIRSRILKLGSNQFCRAPI